MSLSVVISSLVLSTMMTLSQFMRSYSFYLQISPSTPWRYIVWCGVMEIVMATWKRTTSCRPSSVSLTSTVSVFNSPSFLSSFYHFYDYLYHLSDCLHRNYLSIFKVCCILHKRTLVFTPSLILP